MMRREMAGTNRQRAEVNYGPTHLAVAQSRGKQQWATHSGLQQTIMRPQVLVNRIEIATEAANAIRRQENTYRRRSNKSRAGLLLTATLVAAILVLLPMMMKVEAKTHHSKRQVPTTNNNDQSSGQSSSPTGRESTNWWNLWWQQYISETVQPTVRPIVGVTFNGRTIRLTPGSGAGNDQAEASESPASGGTKQQGQVNSEAGDVDTNFLLNGQQQTPGDRNLAGGELGANLMLPMDIERTEKLRLVASSLPDNMHPFTAKQMMLNQRKSMLQQANWQAVKPTMIQLSQVNNNNNDAGSRDGRTNRQAAAYQPTNGGTNEESPTDMNELENLGIQMRTATTSVGRNQQQQQQVSPSLKQLNSQEQAINLVVPDKRSNSLQGSNLVQQQRELQSLQQQLMDETRFEQQQQNQMLDYSEDSEPAEMNSDNLNGTTGGSQETSGQSFDQGRAKPAPTISSANDSTSSGVMMSEGGGSRFTMADTAATPPATQRQPTDSGELGSMSGVTQTGDKRTTTLAAGSSNELDRSSSPAPGKQPKMGSSTWAPTPDATAQSQPGERTTAPDTASQTSTITTSGPSQQQPVGATFTTNGQRAPGMTSTTGAGMATTREQPMQTTQRASASQTTTKTAQPTTTPAPRGRASEQPGETTSGTLAGRGRGAEQPVTTRLPSTMVPSVDLNETPISRAEPEQPATPAQRTSTTSGSRVELMNGRPATGNRQQATTTSARLPTLSSSKGSKSGSTAATTTSAKEQATRTTQAMSSSSITTTTTQAPSGGMTRQQDQSQDQSTGKTTVAGPTSMGASTGRSTSVSGGQQVGSTSTLAPTMGTQTTTMASTTVGSVTTTLAPSGGETNATESSNEDSNEEEGDDDDSSDQSGSTGGDSSSDSENETGGDEGEQEQSSTTTTTPVSTTAISSSGAPSRSGSSGSSGSTRTSSSQATTQQPALTTIDIERLPKVQIGAGQQSTGAKTSMNVIGQPEADITRLKPGAPMTPQRAAMREPSANLIMVTLDGQGREGSIDGNTAITMPMDTLRKILMNQMTDSERLPAPGRGMVPTEEAPATTQAPMATTASRQVTSGSSTPAGGSTFEGKTSGTPGVSSSRSSQATTSSSSTTTTTTRAPQSSSSDSDENESSAAPESANDLDSAVTKKRLQPPPTTRLPASRQQTQLQTGTASTTSAAAPSESSSPSMSSFDGAPGSGGTTILIDDSAPASPGESDASEADDQQAGQQGAREPKIELINLDLMPIQRIMGQAKSEKMATATSGTSMPAGPAQAGTQRISQVPPSGDTSSPPAKQQAPATGQEQSTAPLDVVEPGMRLRPPNGIMRPAQQPTVGSTKTAATTTSPGKTSLTTQARRPFVVSVSDQSRSTQEPTRATSGVAFGSTTPAMGPMSTRQQQQSSTNNFASSTSGERATTQPQQQSTQASTGRTSSQSALMMSSLRQQASSSLAPQTKTPARTMGMMTTTTLARLQQQQEQQQQTTPAISSPVPSTSTTERTPSFMENAVVMDREQQRQKEGGLIMRRPVMEPKMAQKQFTTTSSSLSIEQSTSTTTSPFSRQQRPTTTTTTIKPSSSESGQAITTTTTPQMPSSPANARATSQLDESAGRSTPAASSASSAATTAPAQTTNVGGSSSTPRQNENGAINRVEGDSPDAEQNNRMGRVQQPLPTMVPGAALASKEQRPQQQQPASPSATKTGKMVLGAGKLGTKLAGSNLTSSFIPSKLRSDFGKFNRIIQTPADGRAGTNATERAGSSTQAPALVALPGNVAQNMAIIRQFGGANRMSAMANQPVPFGRPAAMTMQSAGVQRSSNLIQPQQPATMLTQRFEAPTFEYGPAIAVRRPDEPLANGQIPNCTLTGKNFCVLTKDYPMNEVRQAVERSFRSVRIMYEELQTVSDQELHKDDFNATNNQAASGKFACQTQVEMMRPGWAKDEITKEWMLVVNTDVFPQRVRTESCAQPNTPCEFIAPFYDSTCQQRYSLHRMIAIDPHDPSRSPQVAVFKFPAGCVCRVHPIRKTTTTTMIQTTSPSPTTIISSSTSKSIRRR